MNEASKKNRLSIFAAASALIAGLFFFSGWMLERSSEQKHDLKETARHAEIKLRGIENCALAIADSALVLNDRSELLSFFSSTDLSQTGISVFIYDNAELSAWSGNEVTFVSIEKLLAEKKPFVHLPNGWYEMLVQENNNRTAVIFISVHSDYAYQNKYLVNEFNPLLDIASGISLAGNNAGEFVHARDGENLFGINASASTPIVEEKFPLAETCDMFAIVALLSCCVFWGRILLHRSAILTTILICVIVSARMCMVLLRVPHELYNTSLFSPVFYASSFFFGSAGDLFLNILFAHALLLILFRHERIILFYSSLKSSATTAVFYYVLSILLLLFVSIVVNYYITGLIINSKISFSLNNIFELDAFSALGFLVIALLFGFYYLVLRFVSDIALSTGLMPQWRKRFFIFAVFLAFLVVIKNIFTDADFFITYSSTDFIVLILLFLVSEFFLVRKKTIPFPSTVILLLIFSVYASVIISTFNIRKENENLKVLAQKLEAEQDLVAEHLFEEISIRIQSDTIMHAMFKNGKIDMASQHLQQVYFSGYWNRYDVRVLFFNNSGNLLSPSDDSLQLGFYENIISTKSKPTLNENLFFTAMSGEGFSYIARFQIKTETENSPSATMVILLSEKFLQTTGGFPELYLGSNVKSHRDIENYSFGRYHDGKLISASGNFSYPLSPASFEITNDRFYFAEDNGFKHLVYRPDDAVLVVISRKKFTPVIALTLFSYILAFLSLLVISVSGFANAFGGNRDKEISLKQRVHFSVMMVVVVSFVLTGWGTIRYITGKYDKELDSGISRRINEVLHAMENELLPTNMLGNILSDEKTSLLTRLSSNLSADFNLFDLNGRLIFSSQPKLYQQGITSDRMNTLALYELSVLGKTHFVHPESIGRLNYIAAYEPVRNRNNAVEGYIGLPYFEKQAELKKEISSFIGSLMNLYILLLALTLAAAYFISSRITVPLQSLQEKFGAIRLGKHNEQIEWKRKDEIGSLVSEYNRMVEELAVNAEMLARSERESAWREMAKQVAHEIKNPLTPMKLSIQHLQRAMQENSPEVKLLTEKISQTLLEQIDALSSIATAFSSFAKMPLAKKEKVNLEEIIVSVINLYKETSASQLLFSSLLTEPAFVLADKEELLRMFGNIIKNSIQSIPENREGKVEMKIKRELNHCIISIEDNGSGIPEEIIPKIFSPNFTTKTTGMGLGLAIAQSIAESSGGRIRFETKEQSGTTFFIELPLLSESP